MSDDDSEFHFTNTTGQELAALLFRRAKEQESRTSTAVGVEGLLGAALITVAEVLRAPVEAADNPKQAADGLIEFSARWLHRLMQPVTGGR